MLNKKITYNNKLVLNNKSQIGSALIEFSIIIPLFLGLVASIFEIGLFIHHQIRTDIAVQAAARTFRLGQSDGTPEQAQRVKEVACKKLSSVANCNDIRLIVYSFKKGVYDGPHFSDTGVDCKGDGSHPKILFGGEVAIVTICVKRKIYMPGLAIRLDKDGDGYAYMQASDIFIIEKAM